VKQGMNPKKKTIIPTKVKVPFSISLPCFGFLPLHGKKRSRAFFHHCRSPTSLHYMKTKNRNFKKQEMKTRKLSLSPTYLHHNFQETRKKKKTNQKLFP
jgi:hypothetical protein